ncbi:hypothetical protein CLV30_110175 [Haloactinopolyspora alba]|uniref:Uncharacterized protein n=1 Tax=Haloactinopolyspora alba TaxID=648780 RepID=A0A2P8DZ77_9ACTN|nr:hypothetical protein [Haloactinopolyspora alba]PSL02520.1 hypothetical protein CLV30_110175 [Haloactinopolyspora alba]
MLPRRFALVRHVDYTGISGIGVVAYGVVFADGHVALRWTSDHPATSLWESLDDVLAIHGHGDATSVEWLDRDELERPSTTPRGRRARRASSTAAPEHARNTEPPPEIEPSRTDDVPADTTDETSTPDGPPPPPPTSRPDVAAPGTPGRRRARQHGDPGFAATHEQSADEAAVPSQRGPGRHRRPAPEPESRPTRPVESDW